MSNKRETKLYPSTQHFQHQEREIPLATAIAYLQSLQAALPRDDAASATVRGWSGAQVWYTQTLTPLQVAQEKLQQISASVDAAEKGDLKQDELVLALRKLLAP